MTLTDVEQEAVARLRGLAWVGGVVWQIEDARALEVVLAALTGRAGVAKEEETDV